MTPKVVMLTKPNTRSQAHLHVLRLAWLFARVCERLTNEVPFRNSFRRILGVPIFMPDSASITNCFVLKGASSAENLTQARWMEHPFIGHLGSKPSRQGQRWNKPPCFNLNIFVRSFFTQHWNSKNAEILTTLANHIFIDNINTSDSVSLLNGLIV